MDVMIIASFVIAVTAGILLALRFKVFVLVPATLLAVAVIVASSHQPKLATALTSIGAAVLPQIGYVVGGIFPRCCKDAQWRVPAISQSQSVALVRGNGTRGPKWP